MNIMTLARSVGRYAGKRATLRNERRAERFLNGLPHSIRRDIGWPERYRGICD